MKKIILLLFVVVFYSCSSDSSDNNDTDIPSNEKLIHKINNGDKALFLYDGDRIVKGVGNSTSGANGSYYEAFQVEYENNKVKRVYHQRNESWPKPIDFSFDLSDGTHPLVNILDYNYSNNRLISISENGLNVYQFSYDSNGRITDEIRSNLIGYIFRTTKYFYDSNGKVTSYIKTDDSVVTSGSFVTDTNINPIYVLWNKYNFVFPADLSSITNFNTRFFPNNKIVVYNGDQVIETATLISDGQNYPTNYSRNGVNEQIQYLD